MRAPAVCLVVVVAASAAGPARAHVEMAVPTPRFTDGENKWCPCGTGGDGSRDNADCSISASDPDRGSTTNTFAPGAALTIEFAETIDHVGRFRVAFDDDGADQADFDAHVLADTADPIFTAGPHTIDVTLPDVECDRCTLQLV